MTLTESSERPGGNEKGMNDRESATSYTAGGP